MAHRIFVAIQAPKDLQKEISKWVEGFSAKSPAHRETSRYIRWLKGKNLHVTLVPPWEEDDFGVEKVKELLREIKNFGIFHLSLKRISFGPNRNSPRLLWTEGDTPQEILKLKSTIEEKLQITSERRNFILHLTLGRFSPYDFGKFQIKSVDEKIDLDFLAKEFVLMESHLSPSGADYSILDRFAL
jgi:2'-5' RNA ligase